MQYPDIAARLLELQAKDLDYRDRLIATDRLNDGYDPDMEAIHLENATELQEIVNDIGYPTTDKVGKKASAAAWLIVQHAISAPDFMCRYAEHLARAVNDGEASAIQLAYLQDRIAVFSGQPQLYGTQFDWDDNGQLSPNPYDDRALVDARRKQLGMNTLAEQTEVIRNAPGNESPPSDLAARKASYEAWRQRVGWS